VLVIWNLIGSIWIFAVSIILLQLNFKMKIAKSFFLSFCFYFAFFNLHSALSHLT